jgi:hypothetical protein
MERSPQLRVEFREAIKQSVQPLRGDGIVISSYLYFIARDIAYRILYRIRIRDLKSVPADIFFLDEISSFRQVLRRSPEEFGERALACRANLSTTKRTK